MEKCDYVLRIVYCLTQLGTLPFLFLKISALFANLRGAKPQTFRECKFNPRVWFQLHNSLILFNNISTFERSNTAPTNLGNCSEVFHLL